MESLASGIADGTICCRYIGKEWNGGRIGGISLAL